MLVADKSEEEIKLSIGFIQVVRHDILTPEKNPELFEKYHPKNQSPIVSVNEDYEYNLSKQTGLYIGVIDELFLNAFARGNNRRLDLSVIVDVWEGKRANALRIEDQGPGFLYREKIANKRAGLPYADREGKGLVLLDKVWDIIAYQGKGNVVVAEKRYGG